MKNEKLNIDELREKLEPIFSHIEPPGSLRARNIAEKAESRDGAADFRTDRLNYKRTMTAGISLLLVAFLTVAASLVFGKPAGNTVTKSSITMNVSEAASAPAVSVIEEASSEAASVPENPQQSYTNPLAASDYNAVYTALSTIAKKYGYNEAYGEYTGSGQTVKGPASAAANSAVASKKANAATAPGSRTEADQELANQNTDASVSDEYGKTNAQVEGVAEADIIQNDGKYLYYLNGVTYGNGAALQIIKADGTGKLEKLSHTEIPLPQENAVITEMMLAGDRLVIMMTSYQYRCGLEIVLTKEAVSQPTTENWADSGYFNSTEQTTAAVYDISNRKNPKLVRTYSQDGHYISSRLIGSSLYLVSSYTPRYLGTLTAENVKYFVPKAFDSEGSNTSLPAKCITIAPDTQIPTYTVVSAFDVSGTGAASVEAVLGGGNIVYSSLKKLFVAYSRWETNTSKTGIISFELSGAKISYCAFGTVEGSVKDQFFLDEYEGYLRIGTDVLSGNRDNRMYILDSALKIVGSVQNIAPGEDLKSVRYDGKKAYMTTAVVVTDPLFALDLSDPANPKVLGELKIPGFTEYKHFIDENTIISIGAGGNTLGGSDTKLSIFDVTDPANMKELHKISVGDKYSYSIARTNHKAFNYIASKKLLCIPVETYISENNSYYTRHELHVYSVSKEDGFVLKARLTGNIPVSEGSESYISNLYQTAMTRSTHIGNALFGICDNSIVSIDLTSFKKLGEVVLAELDREHSLQQFYVKYPGSPAIISPGPR